MNLERLNLEEVQRNLQPHVPTRILDLAKDERERALLMDLEESDKTRRWLIERSVLTWNAVVDLHVHLDALMEDTIKPMRTLGRISRWIVGAGTGLAALWGLGKIFFKGKP